MVSYRHLYRWGFRPWEGYGSAAATQIAALLDREQAERSGPLGRALDLGCGRGQYTPELARRGWQAVGIDLVPEAIAGARREGAGDLTYVVGDVTDLAASALGRFDFFLDVGCFQGLTAGQRRAAGEGVTALARPRATLLMLAFGPHRMSSVLGAASRQDVETAFPGWELVSTEPAETAGLGWPMNRTAPRWYRLRRLTVDPAA